MLLRGICSFITVALAVFACGCGSQMQNNPMSLIEASSQNSFAIYRSGQPTTEIVKQMCSAGVKTVFALNGMGSQYEGDLAAICPDAHIVYNISQDTEHGVDHTFLETFDQEVQNAKSQGYAMLFHCSCGCHRTGRLAAYYRMKYSGWSADQAIAEMDKIGQVMDEHPTLPAQVRAMEDYIHGRTCSQEADLCVQ